MSCPCKPVQALHQGLVQHAFACVYDCINAHVHQKTVLPSRYESFLEVAGLLLQWDKVRMLKMERCLMMLQVRLDRSFLHKLWSVNKCTHVHPQRTFLRTDTQVQLIQWDRTDSLIMLWVRRCTPKDLLQASNQIGSTAKHPLLIPSTVGHLREQSLGKSWTSVQCMGM